LLVKSLIRPNAGTNPWTNIDLLSSSPNIDNSARKEPVQHKKGKEINKFKLKERELFATNRNKNENSLQKTEIESSPPFLTKYSIIEVRKFLDHVMRLDLSILVENLFKEQIDGKLSVIYEHELWRELRSHAPANICKNNTLLAQCQGYIVGQIKRIRAKEKMKSNINKNYNHQPLEVKKLTDILNIVMLCVKELKQDIPEANSTEIFNSVNKAMECSRKEGELKDEFERELSLLLEHVDKALTTVTNKESLPNNINIEYFNQWLNKVRFDPK